MRARLAAVALLSVLGVSAVPVSEPPPAPVLQIAADEPGNLFRRVSAGGFDYGDCGGLIAAVVLDPEPCAAPWVEAPLDEPQPVGSEPPGEPEASDPPA